MVHARSSNAAPLCHSVQYPDGLKLPAISEQNHRTACIPAHSGQRQRGFCSVKRLSVRLSDREQKLRRPACKRKITRREADVLFIITNNISPVFVTSFILYTQLGLSHLSAVTLLILYFPALLLGSILLSADARRTKDRTAFHAQKQPASGSQMNFKIIDTGIMDGFETLTRLGGYIMLFSMIASLLQKLPVPRVVTLILTGMVEITNGIAMLPDSGLPQSVQYVLAVVYTAFGGLSGIAQTSSMIRDTPLSIKHYCIAKLLLAACCGLLACLVSQIFHL